eukprot:664374-Amphidinium_carterae.1
MIGSSNSSQFLVKWIIVGFGLDPFAWTAVFVSGGLLERKQSASEATGLPVPSASSSHHWCRIKFTLADPQSKFDVKIVRGFRSEP